MSFKPIFYILLFIFPGILVFSQERRIDEVVIVDSAYHKPEEKLYDADSIVSAGYSTDNTLFPKSFAPQFKNKYKSNDFDYEVLKPKESLWDKIKRQIGKWLSVIFKDINPNKVNNYTVLILRFVGILIFVLLFYLLARYFLSKDGNFLFGKRNKKLEIDVHDLEDNIHEIKFPDRISYFENQQDYRSAIRYHFLFSLKKLSDKKMIVWNPEKTNFDYVKELKDKTLQQDFRHLAHIYDYIWYGEFPASEKEYQHYKSYFGKFQI